MGNRVGQARIQTYVINETDGVDTRVYSNEVYIDLDPGEPAMLSSLTASPTVLRIGEVGQQSMILATVSDSFGNPVRNGSCLVQFSSTLGMVDPSTALTDTGRAIAMLTPGNVAGVCVVTASIEALGGEISDSRIVSFISGGASSMVLSADPLEITVGGYSMLSATVRDHSGNLVEIPTVVVFEMIGNHDNPEHGNINNNDPFYTDTTATSNGVAVATFNTGTRTGPQMFRAYTLTPDGQRTDVEATLYNLRVVGGPPAIVSIGYEENGDDNGGGSWIIPISAQVMDQYRANVQDGTVVSFRVDPIGSIEGHGVTNRGSASVDLTYQSENTFDEITVTAYLLTEDDSISSELTFQLPLQRGELELHVDPENMMVEGNEMYDFRVWAILRDGHGVVINNAPILFHANRARFYYDRGGINRPNFEQFAPDPVRRFTGPGNDGNLNARAYDDDPNGNAVVWLRGEEADFFLDPFTQEMTVQIEASVEGFNDVVAEPEFVFITRSE